MARTVRRMITWTTASVVALVGCSTAKTLIYESNDRIYKANADGTEPTLLAKDRSHPSWVPGTKTHIAYLEPKPYTNYYRLWTAAEDGTKAVAVTGFDVLDDYSWSPDGAWIVVSRWVSTNYELFKVQRDGTKSVQLTQNTYDDKHPAWSPNRDRIAFISGRPGKTDFGIYLVDANGKNETFISKGVSIFGYREGRLSWSWDGQRIAFVGRWGGRDHVGIIDAQPPYKWEQITKNPPGKPALLGCYDPHWSGDYLFYFCGDGLYRYDVTTKTQTKLGSYSSNAERSRPSADASHVYFSYRAPSATTPSIVAIQHYTKQATILREGKEPGIWGATIPLLPKPSP